MPGRHRSAAVVVVMAPSGVVTKTRSQLSTTACASAVTQPGIGPASARALASVTLATALTRKPALARLHASALPRRPAPMKPMRSLSAEGKQEDAVSMAQAVLPDQVL